MGIKRPVVLIIMDGIGINNNDYGNAVNASFTPTLNYLYNTCPNTQTWLANSCTWGGKAI